MPKHKRHKKHGRGRTKAIKNKTVKSNNTTNIDFINNFDNSLKENKALSEVSPVQTPNSRKKCVDNINLTPVNRKGSINRDRKLNYASMNVTNLNILFDSNFTYITPKSAKEICINNGNVAYEVNGNTSIPELFSPNSEKLIDKSQKQVNTNNINENESTTKRCNEIIQTPKISKVQLLQERLLEKSCAVPNNRSKNGVNNSNKLFGNEVNINPYLKNKESNKVLNRDGSFGELAFFSPKFFQHKSSTPIAKIHNQCKVDHVNDCSFNISKGDASELFISPRTPKLHLNLNFNNATLSDKVQNKDDSLRSLKMHISKKQTLIHSLESLKNVPQLKVCDKSQQCSYSRIDISKRSLLHDVSCENVCKPGVIEKVFFWLKKCYRVSLNFPLKLKLVCSQFGVQIKSSIISLYKIYNRNSKPELHTPENKSCKCQKYCRDISNLNENIVELKKTVDNLKMQIEDYRSCKENIVILSDELKKTKEEITQFANMRSEMQSLKGQMYCLQAATKNGILPNTGPQEVPAPPPPPPPPLPPMNLLEMPVNKLKITRKNKLHNLDEDSCRPVISLDDILKVKLRKASERAYQTPVNRSNVQPVVSIDMLHQVKLRPASRTLSLRSDTLESTLESTTSPHSGLARFLKTDSPANRLKRLRKVSGYSHDSVYRRNLLKRERDNS